MSFQTMHYEVNINRDQLLNLFLGHGDVTFQLAGQNITINDLSDRNIRRVNNGVEAFSVKIQGVSDNPNVAYIDGFGAVVPIKDSEELKLTLELHLQDHFD